MNQDILQKRVKKPNEQNQVNRQAYNHDEIAEIYKQINQCRTFLGNRNLFLNNFVNDNIQFLTDGEQQLIEFMKGLFKVFKHFTDIKANSLITKDGNRFKFSIESPYFNIKVEKQNIQHSRVQLNGYCEIFEKIFRVVSNRMDNGEVKTYNQIVETYNKKFNDSYSEFIKKQSENVNRQQIVINIDE